MTSINTNNSAMSALQTLRNINSSLETTQNSVSTGYRVDTASDNAAYWSIATTMRSDNKALSAVSDALGLGAAKVDTAYTAMDNGSTLPTRSNPSLSQRPRTVSTSPRSRKKSASFRNNC